MPTPYKVLAAETMRCARLLGLPVRCLPMPAHLVGVLDGRTNGRTVWLTHGAPLHTVAHELAHVMTGTTSDPHGPEWRCNVRIAIYALTG